MIDRRKRASNAGAGCTGIVDKAVSVTEKVKEKRKEKRKKKVGLVWIGGGCSSKQDRVLQYRKF